MPWAGETRGLMPLGRPSWRRRLEARWSRPTLRAAIHRSPMGLATSKMKRKRRRSTHLERISTRDAIDESSPPSSVQDRPTCSSWLNSSSESCFEKRTATRQTTNKIRRKTGIRGKTRELARHSSLVNKKEIEAYSCSSSRQNWI